MSASLRSSLWWEVSIVRYVGFIGLRWDSIEYMKDEFMVFLFLNNKSKL